MKQKMTVKYVVVLDEKIEKKKLLLMYFRCIQWEVIEVFFCMNIEL